jgi:hypothetical protein
MALLRRPSSRSGGHFLDAILPQSRRPRSRLRRRPRGRQRWTAAARHPHATARDRGGGRPAGRLGRTSGRVPAGAQGPDAGAHASGWWRLHRRRRCAPLRADRSGARPPGHRPIHARHVPALVHLRSHPPARPRHRDAPFQSMGRRRRPGPEANDHRCGLHHLRGPRPSQGWRRLWLHPQARLPPPAGHPG